LLYLGSLLFQFWNKVFQSLYLTTDHDGLYEKFGWDRIEDAYDPSGYVTKVYRKFLENI
jgi:hypothetical protein